MGKQQAEASGAKLSRLVLDKFLIVSSPLGRCRETSEIIAGELHYLLSEIEYDDRLKGLSFGDWGSQKLADSTITMGWNLRSSAMYSRRDGKRCDHKISAAVGW